MVFDVACKNQNPNTIKRFERSAAVGDFGICC
jgi:hypothetical protein